MFWFDGLWMMMLPESKAKSAKYKNQLEFRNTFMRYYNMAVSTFEWTGLPATCNERYLETALLTNGMAALIRDPEKGLITLRATPGEASYNIYGEVANINAYGFNGFNKRYSCYMQGAENYDADSLICRDNIAIYPYIGYVNAYAQRFSDIMRTIDVATKKLKVPYFVVAEQSQLESVKKIMRAVDDNEEDVVSSKTTQPNAFQVFPTQIRGDVLKTLWESLENTEAQFRTILGIDSAPTTKKKERLITDEVNSNNEFTEMNIDHRLRQREIFCETANRMFGLNISVKLAEPMDRDNDDVNETGGDSNDSTDTGGSRADA